MIKPIRVWLDYQMANRHDAAYDLPPRHIFDGVQDEYILATSEALAASPEVQALIEAAVSAEREALEVACQIEIDRGDKHGGPQYAAGARACRDAIRNRSQQ